jgi:hypothetical protein
MHVASKVRNRFVTFVNMVMKIPSAQPRPGIARLSRSMDQADWSQLLSDAGRYLRPSPTGRLR